MILFKDKEEALIQKYFSFKKVEMDLRIYSTAKKRLRIQA